MLKKKKVVVAMSGGVDSSVTAALLLEEGYEVIGITMRLMDINKEGGKEQSCCGLEAVQEAKQVAEKLKIPHYVLNLEEEFEREVIEYFCREYSRGRTPHPCILCNQKLKFGRLLEKAKGLGIDLLASGHYARVDYDAEKDRYLLKRGRDRAKDQSYVLFNLTQEQLGHILLPLGGLEKREVRERARGLGLRVHARPDSQEICFIPDGDYGNFLRQRMPGIMKPGPIVDKKGKVLGRHQGIHLFTIGQRRGLGMAAGRPLYVISIDREERTVIVGESEDICRRELIAAEVNWIARDKLIKPRLVKAKIRYRHSLAEATLIPLGEGEVKVKFSSPQQAITPGQAVVFYQGEEVLGGGWIKD